MVINSKPKNVALVLSSGGARGLAHIGVIEELQQRGYTITSVAGSSMGALVGGLFATGKIDEFRNWVVGLDKMDVLSLIDFTLTSKGFIKGDKVFDRMRKLNLIPDVNIEDLAIPYTAVAVDITNNRECVFNSGSILKAIRSSISIPSVFTPVNYNNSFLVDGGVLNPMPLNHVRRNNGDLLIAVDLNALTAYEKPNIPKPKKKGDSQKEKISLLKKWDKLFGHNGNAILKDAKMPKQPSIGYFDVLSQSILLMQSRLTEYAIEITPPDIVVPISKESSTVFEFYKAEELIAYGKIMCAKSLDSSEL